MVVKKAKPYARGLTQAEYQKEAIRRKKWHETLAGQLTLEGWGTYITDTVDYELIYTVIHAVAPHALTDTVTNHEESKDTFIGRLRDAIHKDTRASAMRRQLATKQATTEKIVKDRLRKEVRKELEEEFAHPSPT